MEEIDLQYESAQYCFKCGKPLTDEVKERYGFNRYTGEPVYKYTKRCPDYNERQYSKGRDHDLIVRYDRVQ